MSSKLNMIEVVRLPVGQLKANCYLVYDNETKDTLIIDPGDDGQYIIKKIQQNDLSPKLILATHGHFDHLMAVNELKLSFKIPFIMSQKDEFLLQRMQETAKYFVGTDPGPPPSIDKFLDKETDIKMGNYTFDVIDTPGHTPGGVSIHQKREKLLFVGDLIFKDGFFGRTDFSYSSKLDLERSVDKIFELPDNTSVFSGHGTSTNIRDLKLYLG